jgi:PKD repeat protein
MKQLTSLLLLAVVAVSCNRNSNGELRTTSGSNYPPPTAAFKIENQTAPGEVKEAVVLTLANLSTNADSYSWDFGNGTILTGKTPNFFFPLHGNYKVTLTVTGAYGRTASSSMDLSVWCSRGLNHAPIQNPD